MTNKIKCPSRILEGGLLLIHPIPGETASRLPAQKEDILREEDLHWKYSNLQLATQHHFLQQ